MSWVRNLARRKAAAEDLREIIAAGGKPEPHATGDLEVGKNQEISEEIVIAVEQRGSADERTPAYYHGGGNLQPFDVIDAFGLDFYLGNAVKYICRAGRKGGAADEIGDLRKARHYLEAAIRRREAGL